MPKELREMIIDILDRRTGAAVTSRNIAMWLGHSVADVRKELEQLHTDGLAITLPTSQGREPIWVTTKEEK